MNHARVEVHESAEVLATEVAGALLGRLAAAQAAGREPHISLTGGTIADRIHREIARLSPGSEVDWSRVVVWWGDERFVAADSTDRNELGARTAFLDAVGATQVHPILATDAAPDAAAAATAYADELRSLGAGEFEVVMLGVGPDGHVASLFPGHAALTADGIAVAVTDSPKPPPERVTLTFAALNRTRACWFLVSGAEKAEAVAAALADVAPEQTATALSATPARGVNGAEDTTWFLDRPAAAAL